MVPLRRRMIVVSGFSVAVCLLTAWPAVSQESREGGLRPEEFGTTDEVTYNLNPSDFQVRVADWSDASFVTDIYVAVTAGATSVSLAAPIHLPAGVKITSVLVNYYDSHTSSEPSAGLFRNSTIGVRTAVASVSFPNFSGGYAFAHGIIDTDIDTIDNENYHYSFEVTLTRSAPAPAQEERLVRVRIRYVRQVSPAPFFATFDDVSNAHPQFQFIEALVRAGITAGCGGGNYCPDTPITRGQMAVFLSAALGLHWPLPAIE